jgi:Bacterial Ig domain/Divergent InlB B-repeat domain
MLPRLLLLAVLCAACATLVPTASAATPEGTLTVTKEGSGTVTGGGIDCGATCSVTLPYDCAYDVEAGGVVCAAPNVSLTATPSPGWTFQGWTNCPSASGTQCDRSATSAGTTVKATFADVTPPSMTLYAYGNSAQVTTGMQPIVVASDTAGIAKVEFKINGTVVATDTTVPYQRFIDLTPYPDGSRVDLEAVTYDVGGNTVSASRWYTIDRTLQASIVAGIGEGELTESSTPNVEIAYDSDVTSVDCSYDGGAFLPCETKPVIWFNDPPDGERWLRIRVIDDAGNMKMLERRFIADRNAPVAAIESPAEDAMTDGAFTLVWSVDDATAVTATCALDGAAAVPCDSQTTMTYARLAPGYHTVKVTLTDELGRVTTFQRRVQVPGGTTDSPQQPSETPQQPGGEQQQPGGEQQQPGGGTTTDQPRIAAKVKARWSRAGARARLRSLAVTGIPAGAKLALTCKGSGCPKRLTTPRVRNGAAALKGMKGTLGRRAVLELRFTAPGRTPQVVRFTVGKAGRVTRADA